MKNTHIHQKKLNSARDSKIISRKRCIHIGEENFFSLIKNGIYVDKTNIIKDLLVLEYENCEAEYSYQQTLVKSKVLLIIRPPRFGKTLMLNMLDSFFNYKYRDSEESIEDPFVNLNITKCSDIVENHKWVYPVIKLSFGNIRGKETIDEFKKSFRRAIQDAYEKFNDIEEHLDSTYQMKYAKVVETNNFDTQYALVDLVRCITYFCERKGILKKPIILIDEYDTPFISALENGYWEEALQMIRDFLHACCKGEYSGLFEFMIITGVTQLARENLFSDFNNAIICTLADPKFSSYFGFTQEEIKHYYINEFVEPTKQQQVLNELENWYGYYYTGNSMLFNAWSVVHALFKEGKIVFKPYWGQLEGGTDYLLKQIISMQAQIKDNIVKLINHGIIEVRISQYISIKRLISDNLSAEVEQSTWLWSFLYLSGYLTAIPLKNGFVNERGYHYLMIPNREVFCYFRDAILPAIGVDDDKIKDSLIFKPRQQIIQQLLTKYYRCEKLLKISSVGKDTSERYLLFNNEDLIKKTLEWFWKHPNRLEVQYRFSEFWYRLRRPQGRIDTELYHILRILHQLGGRGYIQSLYEEIYISQPVQDEEGSLSDEELSLAPNITITPQQRLYQKFKNIFDTLYRQDNQIVNRLDPKDHKQAKKRALLLQLMPILKTRINRFGRKHGMRDVISFTKECGTNANIHKGQIGRNKLPEYYFIQNKENPIQEKRRKQKAWIKPISKGIAFLVAVGQAVIGAYAFHAFILHLGTHIAWLSAPICAPLFAALIAFCTLTTNYILFRNRTINTLIQFFIDKKLFGGFKHPAAKALAILGLLSALCAGFIMGAISWIGCMNLISYSPVAIAAGASLMVLNLVSYTSLMYVSIINLMKRIEPKLNTKYWLKKFNDIKAEWKTAPIETTLRWIFNACFLILGLGLLVFSLTSLLGFWLDQVVLFFTDTLPVFMQVSPEIAQVISITLVLGFAAMVRSAFNFESIFSLVETCTDLVLDNLLANAIRAKFNGITEEKPKPVEQDRLSDILSDIWNDPLNTVFHWMESGFKYCMLILNATGFSALATMEYGRLGEIGIKNELVAKIGSFEATATVSLGAVSSEMRKALEPETGKVFSSPISQPNSRRNSVHNGNRELLGRNERCDAMVDALM